jgi:hypothetical protein
MMKCLALLAFSLASLGIASERSSSWFLPCVLAVPMIKSWFFHHSSSSATMTQSSTTTGFNDSRENVGRTNQFLVEPIKIVGW